MPSVIQVRGTTGQGKQRLIDHMLKWSVDAHGYEITTVYWPPGKAEPFALVGSHGTIDKLEPDYKLPRVTAEINKFLDSGYNVIYFTEKHAADVNHTLGLHRDGIDIHVIVLSSNSVDQCREELAFRREWSLFRFNMPSEKMVKQRRSAMQTAVRKLRRAGVPVVSSNLRGASEYIRAAFFA